MPDEDDPPIPPYNSESIMDNVKKALNLSHDYDAFDEDIRIHINSTFSTLHQLGVGSPDPFYVEDRTQLWEEFFLGRRDLMSTKSYIYAKVRLLFDSASMTAHAETALKEMCNEWEHRLRIAAETPA